MNRTLPACLGCLGVLTLAGAASAASAPAAPPPHYETTVVHGTTVNAVGFFRINTGTGATVNAWGGGTQFATVVDNTPVPAGDYHLTETDSIGLDSKVIWWMYRYDAVSGRSWVASGGGNAPLVWNEIQPPK